MESKGLKRSLDICQWHALCEQGVRIPVQIPINGVSMLPLIRRNRDIVCICAPERELLVGDIVLFADPERNRYVLHRLWERRDGRVLTWGDNCIMADGWREEQSVWGIAVSMERDGKIVRFDTEEARKRGMRIAYRRHAYCRGRSALMRVARPIWHAVKKIIRA